MALLDSGLSAHRPRRYTGKAKATPAPEPDAQGSVTDVPDANVAKVLEWVDGDPERAQQALDHENTKDTPRKTLVHDLTNLILDV